MSTQEVIDIMKIAIAEVEWNYPLDYAIAFEEAIKALKKQIPKKPIGDLHSVPHYRCPLCKSGVKSYEDSSVYPYCHHCGQALDWSCELKVMRGGADSYKLERERLLQKLQQARVEAIQLKEIIENTLSNYRNSKTITYEIPEDVIDVIYCIVLNMIEELSEMTEEEKQC